MRHPTTWLVLLLFLAPSLEAQVRTADPATRGVPLTAFPRFIRLAPNVFAYEEIRAPGFTTVSLVVVGSRGVMLADGQGSPAATRTLLEKIRGITSLPVRWYVVGSDHGDHTAGNSVLPPEIAYFVHPASHAQLVRDSAAAVSANARAAADAAAKGGPLPAPRVVVVPPNAMSADEATIDLGGITARVLFLGRAHTGGDLMVHLPREKILFMSEAYLNRVFPAMRSAYPSEWVRMIDRTLGMDVDHYVPGHGFVEEPAASREELVAFRGALQTVIGEAKRLHALGLTVDQAVQQARWRDYGGWFLAQQQAPIAVRKVYEEIEGKLGPR
jgi:glyoxylase-like metal-dependent hydrolase (beta-lactamase superfamily II)